MKKQESGRIINNNVTLIEYLSEKDGQETFFVQCGIAGMNANIDELKSLYSVLNYYFNLETLSQCKFRIEDEDVTFEWR